MSFIGRKLVPSSTITRRMDALDQRYQRKAEAQRLARIAWLVTHCATCGGATVDGAGWCLTESCAGSFASTDRRIAQGEAE